MRRQDRRQVTITPQLTPGQWVKMPSGTIYYKGKKGELRRVTDPEVIAKLNAPKPAPDKAE